MLQNGNIDKELATLQLRKQNLVWILKPKIQYQNGLETEPNFQNKLLVPKKGYLNSKF